MSCIFKLKDEIFKIKKRISRSIRMRIFAQETKKMFSDTFSSKNIN